MESTHKKTNDRWSWGLVAALALVFWLVVCLLDCSWYALSLSIKGQPVPWRGILHRNVPYWVLAAILTLPVMWVARHASFERGRRLRSLVIHVGTLLAFAVVHRSATQLVYFPFEKGGISGYFANIPKFVGTYMDIELLLYLVIIGAVYLSDYYSNYRERARAAAALELERAQLLASLRGAELEALRMQLQPHFLFNVLHAISTLILKGETRAADQMISQLSHFLRLTLDGPSKPVVPLEVELEFLDAYLRIQKVRFQERLQVRTGIEPRARRAEVPHLILQPLVENCIQHAVESDAGAVEIVIRATVVDDTLDLVVEDNGPGLRGEEPLREGHGLRNIRARLQALHPGAHELGLTGLPGGGTRATIRIPFRPVEEEPMGDRGTRVGDDDVRRT